MRIHILYLSATSISWALYQLPHWLRLKRDVTLTTSMQSYRANCLSSVTLLFGFRTTGKPELNLVCCAQTQTLRTTRSSALQRVCLQMKICSGGTSRETERVVLFLIYVFGLGRNFLYGAKTKTYPNSRAEFHQLMTSLPRWLNWGVCQSSPECTHHSSRESLWLDVKLRCPSGLDRNQGGRIPPRNFFALPGKMCWL